MQQQIPRIISWENIEQRIDIGASFMSHIPGTPEADIFYDAHRGELGFAIETDSTELPTVEPVSISISLRSGDKKQRLEIRSADRVLFREFYDFCVEIIDSSQTDQVLPHKAVDAAWGAWVRLLDRKAILSKEKQLGLLGELWLLRRIANSRGWHQALDCWHKEANSEHDFCLPTVDIEVKSTTNELRIHLIGSATQLMKSPSRDLYLLSLQFTPGMKGAFNAASLQSEIQEIELSLESELLQRFESRLTSIGWRREHSRHYCQYFVHRSRPTLIEVNEECPRLTLPMIAQLGNAVANRVGSLSYRIDVTGLGHEEGTDQFDSLLPTNDTQARS